MSTVGRIEDLLQGITHMQEAATVKSVFGDPVQVDGRTIVPVAQVKYAMGMGMGRGTSTKDGQGEGSGGGGGGSVTVRPVAVLEVRDGAVKVTPIPDVTRLALAGVALLAWNVFWITLTVRKGLAQRRDHLQA